MKTITIISIISLIVFSLQITAEAPEDPTAQITQLSGLVGDVLPYISSLQEHFTSASQDGRFTDPALVTRTIDAAIDRLQQMSNVTESLLQHSQFQQYRTITSALRIINNSGVRLSIDLNRMKPAVVGTDMPAQQVNDMMETLGLSYKLIKQYLAMLIEKS